jgi:AbrB family looped-hinge helix DNA binding protein
MNNRSKEDSIMPRVGHKGQITIPAAVRRLLQVKEGDEVIFEVKDHEVQVRKGMSAADAFKKYLGYLAHLKGRSTDDLMGEIRGRVDDISD